MRLDRLERASADGTCNAGKVFYSCQVNSFRGCCSVDPCNLPACPDAVASPTTTSVSRSTSRPAAVQTPESIPNSILAPTVLTASTLPTLIVVDDAFTPTPTPTRTPTQSQAHTQTASSAPSSIHKSDGSSTPMIAGIASAVAALLIISALVWCCVCRRRAARDSRNSMAPYGAADKEFVLERTARPGSSPASADVFAPFGGHYQSPRRKSAFTPAGSGPSTIEQEPTASRDTNPALASGPGSRDGQPDPTTPTTNQSVQDPEKITRTPPPVHEHPFFHPLPDEAAEVPANPPGVPGNANLTPTMPQTAALRSPRNYHISELQAHPALRADLPPSPPPRERAFPPLMPEVRNYRSSSPLLGSTQHHDRYTTSSPSPQQTWRLSELSADTALTATTLESPILGRSELEADVPSAYPTPATTVHPSPPPMPEFDFGFGCVVSSAPRRSPIASTSYGDTDPSTQPIPNPATIGLGVDSTTVPTRVSSLLPLPLPLPLPLHTNPDPETRPDFDPSRSTPLCNNNTTTTPSLPANQRVFGALGPNLNSPRDGAHVMSWASDGYGYAHASTPAASPTTHAPTPDEEGEGANPHQASDEKEVARPDSGTPLSWLTPEVGTASWGSWSG